MSLFPAVYALLNQDAAVEAIVGTRIYRHGAAPQSVIAPYVTWSVITATPENTLSELPRVDRHEIQVDAWSDNAGSGSRGVEGLALAIRAALEPHAYCEILPVDERDIETQRYRISQQFTFWHHRPDLVP